MDRAFPDTVTDWADSGRLVDTAPGRVFVRRSDGSAPYLVFLHGYPTSGYDFRHVIDRVPERATLALDFLGFGLSDKPRPHRYSIFEHDMGTSVATELMARDFAGTLSFRLRRVVLSNGGVIIERAGLRPIQRVLLSPLGPLAALLSNRLVFAQQLGRLFSADHPLDRREAAAQWALVSNAGGHRIAHLLCRYVRERSSYARRWHGAIGSWEGTLGFVWGLRDPVATGHVLNGLRELRPSAPVIELAELGHYPQLEDPEAFTEAMLRLLDDRSS
ncbi:Pimeloyl-ACP methyl ester carboxylesterase [Haloechinothrix alba]|uniref:Pimeloyl-ACP methyl ester carboxylesterase n=1 Tax=Haloechinothrix alba TaxID=664784 RepID=A0A238W740_9PSEU|nr:alpha/beta hydrolase [Haloechinothrix alba]SNR42104.1 Pimeloyl-ACP methyl ester carboxylesterase [Haloechinothrix alba]